jgi:hypothetical protein
MIWLQRREFMAPLGGATVAWPLAGRGQQGGAMRRIGVLMALAADDREGQTRVTAGRDTKGRGRALRALCLRDGFANVGLEVSARCLV